MSVVLEPGIVMTTDLCTAVTWDGVIPQRLMRPFNGLLVVITMSNREGSKCQQRDVFANHLEQDCSFSGNQSRQTQ